MSERSKSKQVSWTLWAVVAALLSYPLSVGPVYWLVDACHGPSWVLLIIYAPLLWLGEASPTFFELMRWYIGLWVEIPD